MLFPVGDDHVRLAAWLPENARERAAPQAPGPGIEVRIGGYHDHLPRMGTPNRHPSRRDALAGVRPGARERRFGAHPREAGRLHRATTLLVALRRAANPTMAGLGGHQREELGRGRAGARSRVETLLPQPGARLRRWLRRPTARHRETCKARYRMGRAARRRTASRGRCVSRLAQRCGVERAARAGQAAPWSPSTPGRGGRRPWWRPPACRWRSLDGGDRLARQARRRAAGPVQLPLGGTARSPHLRGRVPRLRAVAISRGRRSANTPLFGKYLQGILATETAPGTVRLDVGLGDAPVTPASLADDQRRVEPLLKKAERFKVVMHYGGPGSSRRWCRAAPAPELSLVPISFVAGKPATDLPAVRKLDGVDVAIACRLDPWST